ncbi:hypothetical protein BCR44DRAFT_1441051 [Catenaria anguillulae PL171]|uniref:Uncharacterized protein n=1 Tax=Catenaria anguillulae PL171 TaxID=765915 RepID=A0A1Y2HBZ3_9FUNG|nr:hypothetical protein BCR44DRAFT_1441051 [Catenaria anguillulae PL171]
MPTPERRTVVHRRSLAEFRSNISLTDPDAITQAFLVAEVQIDNLTHQLQHLNQLHRDHVAGKQSLIVPVDVHVRQEEQLVRKRPSEEAAQERLRREKERQELRGG